MEIANAERPSFQSFGVALKHIIERQLSLEPVHGRYLSKRFASVEADEAELLEELAQVILKMTGENIDQCCRDYDWLTKIVLDEEMYFRRHDSYRLQTLEQAIEQVYSRTEYMTRYMNGLLMTQLWWANHTKAMLSYKQDFLADARGRCLEIGPGHGLLLLLASRSGFDSVEALDISEASTDLTKEGLRRAGADPDAAKFKFHIGNLFDETLMAPFHQLFDRVVFSEVLEHLDRPADAMKTLYAITKPGGVCSSTCRSTARHRTTCSSCAARMRRWTLSLASGSEYPPCTPSRGQISLLNARSKRNLPSHASSSLKSQRMPRDVTKCRKCPHDLRAPL